MIVFVALLVLVSVALIVFSKSFRCIRPLLYVYFFILSVLAGLLFYGYKLPQYFFSNKFFFWFGMLSLLVNPPADLYRPIALVPVKSEIQEYQTEVRHKYIGEYVISIEADNVEDTNWVPENLVIEYQLDGLRERFDFRSPQPSLVGYYKKKRRRGGVFLGSYVVPDDAPINTLTTFTVVLDGAVDLLEKKRGGK